MPTTDAMSILRDEHRALRACLRDLKDLIDDDEAPQLDMWWWNVRQRVLNLKRFLERHFEREEQGIYQSIQEERPTLVRKLEVLRQDHAALLAELNGTVEIAQAETPHDTLRTKTLGWINALADHEAREVKLFQEALIRDAGTKD